MNIIIDTDPGVDDSLAIILAELNKDINLKALCTIYGNSTIENTTKNACTILQLIQSSTPIYKGCNKPIYGNAVIGSSHGENGLGGFCLKNLIKKPEKNSAIEFYIKELELCKKPIKITCLGPVTNLAIVLNVRPDLEKKIEELIILGGVINEKGNISEFAEFNTINDPYSLSSLLENNIKKTLIPIDVCRKVVFEKEYFNKIKKSALSKSIKKITDNYISYYTQDKIYGGFSGGVMYDVLAVAYLINPELFSFQNVFLDVVTEKKENFGQTFILSRNKKKNIKLATGADSKRIKELFIETVNSTKNLSS